MSNIPSKKIKDICADLGKPYIIKAIDLENVIYRDLGNGFDLEISGLDNQKKSFNVTLFVWETKNNVHVIETISDIKSLDELKSYLNSISTKYLNLDVSNFNISKN
ncbi:hypothetical protein [uncultured Clostridium sp.]|uniref:hypothetical protein n=1 Tax=uncultured Clostridium sp. TaxID=59620 RepID=UPI0028E91C95|nr:hypothetical protein [uncultured Clostridium sp.]